MSKKLIIVFEGIEGSGKSHHINKVTKYLRKINKNFIQIREPGGSKNSEKIWAYQPQLQKYFYLPKVWGIKRDFDATPNTITRPKGT